MAYNVSNRFKEIIYSGDARYDCKLYINNTLVPVEQISSIKISSPIIDTTSETGKLFHIGTFISQSLEIQFRNLNGLTLTNNPEVRLEIGVNVDGTYEYVPIGKYLVDDLAEDYQTSCMITCLDYAVKFKSALDISQFFNHTETIEEETVNYIYAYELFEAICGYYGITVGTYPNVNKNKKIYSYDSTITGKQYIMYLAELFGGNAKMQRDGSLSIIPLKNIVNQTIDALTSKELQVADTYTLSRVCFDNGLVKYQAGGNVITVKEFPTTNIDTTAYYYLTTDMKYYKYVRNNWVEQTNFKNTLYISNDNLFITQQSDIDNIYSAVQGFEVTNLKCVNRMDISLDCWDIITITAGNKQYQTFYDNYINFNGVCMGEVNTNIPLKVTEETTNVIKESDSTKIRKLSTIVNEQEGKIDIIAEEAEDAVTTANEASSKASELELRVDEIDERVSEHTEEIQQVQDQTQINTDEIAALGSTSTEEGQTLTINSSNNPATIEVWGNTELKSFLPSEYTQVEYIESTGTQYIDTGIKPCMNKIRCVCDMIPTANTDSAFFGTRGTYYLFYNVENNYFWPISKCETIEGTLTVGNKYHVDWNKGTLEVTGSDGVYQKAVRSNNTQDNTNMYIFNFNPLDGRHSKAKLYYFKIYVEDVLVRDFIPCYRNSDNVVGMYDLVSNTFFVNQGTGAFTKGNNAQLPTPDFPQRIRNVGDNINLFDETQLGSERDYQCTSSVSNNEITLTSTSSSGVSLCRLLPILNLKPNTTYSVSYNYNGNLNQLRLYDVDASSYIDVTTSGTPRRQGTFTTGNNTRYELVFYVVLNGTLTISKIKVEESSIATPYTPYNRGSIDLLMQNKNLFNKNNINLINTYYVDNTGKIVYGTYNKFCWLQLEPNTTYTLSQSKKSNVAVRIGLFSSQPKANLTGTLLGTFTGTTPITQTFTTTASAIYVGWVYCNINNLNNYTEQDMLDSIQLEEAEEATSYEEHKEQIIQLSLPQDFELCKIGDYTDYIYKSGDKWFKHKVINKVILNGSSDEDWHYWSGNFYINVPNGVGYDIVSNYFKKSVDTYSADYGSILYNGNSNKNMLFKLEEGSTVANVNDWRTWLFNNNTTVYYALATPIEEEIIDEDMLTALNNIYTYKGITHIWCIDEIIPSKMKVTYYPNTPFNDTLVTKDTFEKVTNDLSASINIKANEVETSVKEETTSTILTLLNNGYLTAEQVNALVNGNAEDIATIKQQLTQTITNSQMQIAITSALEGGVSYLKNTLFTIDENGMAIATSQDEFNALYNNKGMYLYSFQQMIAKFDVDGATITGTLTVKGDLITPCTKKSKITVNGVVHEYTHWIGG